MVNVSNLQTVAGSKKKSIWILVGTVIGGFLFYVLKFLDLREKLQLESLFSVFLFLVCVMFGC